MPSRCLIRTSLALAALFLVASAPPLSADSLIADPHAAQFDGETCLSCHDGKPPPATRVPAESFDVVIVGGGMAGLSALKYLKDVGRVVLLELEKEVGGQMRLDEWRGIKFAKGAAYFVEPYGILTDFYRSEGIQLVKIAHPENSAWIDGKYYPNCWSGEGREKMPWLGPPKKAWVDFLKEEERVNDYNESNQPFENFYDPQQQLDTLSTSEWLRKVGLTPAMIAHFNLYIPSCFGETAEMISASAFSNYISGEIGGNYTLPGGLGGLTQRLYHNYKDRIRLGCRVTEVGQTLHGCRVTYLGPDGNVHTISAKSVVMAVPCNLLPGLIPDLPQEKLDVIRRTKYAAYTVGAVLCNEVLWDDKGYDTWIKGMFFKDIIDATWIERGGKPYPDKKRPHVLSLYIPNGIGGLKPQMEWSHQEFEERVLRDMERVIPGSRSKIAGVRFYRYGHSMHVCEPGFLTRSVPILRKPFYRIYFAGAEVEGLPCNESAVLSGYKAAAQVRAWLWDQPPTPTRWLPDRLKRRLAPAARLPGGGGASADDRAVPAAERPAGGRREPAAGATPGEAAVEATRP